MKTTKIVTDVTDREWEQITGVKVNRAAQRRKDAAERAGVAGPRPGRAYGYDR